MSQGSNRRLPLLKSGMPGGKPFSVTSLADDDVLQYNATTGAWENVTLATFEAALTILESQITDGSVLARLAAAETVTGQWTFDAGVILDDGSAAAPTIKGSDSNSGLYFESSGRTLSFSRDGSRQWSMGHSSMGQDEANRPVFFSQNASATNPNIVPNAGDVDTGLGANAADQLSLIAGSIEGIRLSEASGAVLQTVQSNVSLAAHAGSSQGDGVITSSFNVYDTVGTAGDAATLPAAFAVGTKVHIKNGAAANSMDVFPASGDDAGGGADTAVAIAAGDFAVFLATTANATWEKIMGGTA